MVGKVHVQTCLYELGGDLWARTDKCGRGRIGVDDLLDGCGGNMQNPGSEGNGCGIGQKGCQHQNIKI